MKSRKKEKNNNDVFFHVDEAVMAMLLLVASIESLSILQAILNQISHDLLYGSEPVIP